MPYPEIALEIALQLLVLKFVGVIDLEELQLGAFLEFDFVVLRSVVWQPFYVFGVERRVPLVFCRDFPRFVVPLRALVVRELAAGRDFGHFGVLDPFLELRVPVVVDRDDGYLGVSLSLCSSQDLLSALIRVRVTAASS